ncbi:class I SAM-dependent methyltransferase [Streptomyces sp. NPDC003032]
MDAAAGERLSRRAVPGSARRHDALDPGEGPAYFAVRTRFFDDGVIAATRRGARQVVTLAVGVDGRTVRLDLPTGTRWSEVELPLACERHGVAADLREDRELLGHPPATAWSPGWAATAGRRRRTRATIRGSDTGARWRRLRRAGRPAVRSSTRIPCCRQRIRIHCGVNAPPRGICLSGILKARMRVRGRSGDDVL